MKITTNGICYSSTLGGGRGLEGRTDMKQREESEGLSGNQETNNVHRTGMGFRTYNKQ